MAFVAAMASPDLTKQGVKGSDVYTEEGMGDLRVALFTQLVRGQTEAYIAGLVEKILPLGFEQVRDLIVMAFQTRDVRGGKGERKIFYSMITAILKQKPQWQKDILRLVPEYGCWRDMWEMHPIMPEAIDAVVLEQFRLDQESERPSLLAKWLPREKSQHDSLAHYFATLFFPTIPAQNGQRMRQYRRTVSLLNRLCDTTEIKMCANTWAEINPKHVPGRLMKRCKLAFFNQKKGANGQADIRCPHSKDREACADNFRSLLKDVAEGKTTMKGAHVVMPHELVHEIMLTMHCPASEEIEETRQAQWNAIRDESLTRGGLGKVVPMCDFSGSMDGVPKEVSLALGILISEVASADFKDHILTFDSEPRWHSFKSGATLREKCRSIGSLGQGLSTDFQKACDLVLRKLVENNVAPEDAPTDLLVLTDMGFDNASGSYRYVTRGKGTVWETHFQMIRDSFARHGYQPPRIVCWNLRAEYKDFHARAGDVGVVQLSGWSPAVLKAIQGSGIVVETPYMGMRRLLDDERYDKVREVVNALQKAEVTDTLRSA